MEFMFSVVNTNKITRYIRLDILQCHYKSNFITQTESKMTKRIIPFLAFSMARVFLMHERDSILFSFGPVGFARIVKWSDDAILGS